MSRHLWASWVVCWSVVGCDDPVGKDSPNSSEHDPPELFPRVVVETTLLDFGPVHAVEWADQPTHLTMEVRYSNRGDGPLQLQEPTLDGGSGAFTWSDLSALSLPPGEQGSLRVTFTPQRSGAAEAALVLGTDDPDRPEVRVPLRGDGLAPVLDLSVEDYDFGAVPVGCTDDLTIRLNNTGDLPLQVDAVDLAPAGGALALISGPELPLPWFIEPDGSIDVVVAAGPLDESADAAVLHVVSNDPERPDTGVTLAADGAYGARIQDTFEQTTNGKVDILFAVDRSSSMYDDVEKVSAHVGELVDTLTETGTDFQLAAVSEDSGCIHGSDLFIDDTFGAADAAETLSRMVNMGGSYGSNSERGFMLLEASLDESAPGGCNEGLVRPDAALHLVGVSDEPEQSVNPYTYYTSRFQSFKASPDDVVIHAIGGDYPSGCDFASAYTGFYEATVATGGVFLSICLEDWDRHMWALAAEAHGETAYVELSHTPVVPTIDVRVDGVTTTAWIWDHGFARVVFDADAIPEAGTTITVDYVEAAECAE